MMVGPRGVGKTFVLLDQMRKDPEAGGIHTVRIEAPYFDIAADVAAAG